MELNISHEITSDANLEPSAEAKSADRFEDNFAHKFIVAHKPAGFPTHAPDVGLTGFVEILNETLELNLHVVHRLDKETSGVILFAQTAASAEYFRQLFVDKKLTKQYLLVAEGVPNWDLAVVRSTISKAKGNEKTKFKSQTPVFEKFDFSQTDLASLLAQQIQKLETETAGAPDGHSCTVFLKKQQHQNFCQLEAYPITGRSHQIRLHAQDLGIPILGDTEHGGSSFVRLCLHAHQLQWGSHKYHSPGPSYFRDLTLINEERQLGLASALHRRQMLWQWKAQESLRLYHQEPHALEIDQYGDALWFYIYDESLWTEERQEQFKKWSTQLGKKFVLRKMQNRGKDSNENLLLTSPDLPPRWLAYEQDRQFEVRTDSGLSPGLFLDQRDNRSQLQSQCQEQSVLNLFAYTGLFSVAAALGGAKAVTTVDLSKSFIDWSKQNFLVNDLASENSDFWYQDSFVFLKGALKREKKYHWIILDPPSFSRSKEGIFKIEKNLPDLLAACLPVLADGGYLHFTINYEQWDSQELQQQILQALKALKTSRKAKFIKKLRSGWDFELPNQETLMKGFLIQFS